MSETLLQVHPKKGELYFANFEGKGSVQNGIRPALIVQNDFINETDIKTTIVCPLTSKLRNLSTHVLLKPNHQNGLDQNSEVIVEQILVINKSQLIKKIGSVSEHELRLIEQALLLVFDIPQFSSIPDNDIM